MQIKTEGNLPLRKSSPWTTADKCITKFVRDPSFIKSLHKTYSHYTRLIQQNFLSELYLYKALSNRFYKWITSAKLITSINLAIKMYRFQKNRLFGA